MEWQVVRSIGLDDWPDRPEWARSHLQMPTPVVLNNTLHIYFSTRDGDNRSHVGLLTTSRINPLHAVAWHDMVMAPGARGQFDDCGVMPSCVYQEDGTLWMDYIGWTSRVTVPHQTDIGLAELSTDGRHAKSRFACFDRDEDRYFTTTPFTTRNGDIYYATGTGWFGNEPRYDIKTRDLTCLAAEDEAACRPWVISEDNMTLMFFCKRKLKDYRTETHAAYRIYCVFEREGGWYSYPCHIVDVPGDMFQMAYPAVIEHGGNWHLFFSGGRFGEERIYYCKRVT